MSYSDGERSASKHLFEVPENLSSDRPLQSDPKVNENLKIATHYGKEDPHISYDSEGIRFSDASHSGIKVQEDINLIDHPREPEDPVILTDPVRMRKLLTATVVVFVILLISVIALIILH
ncbi:MAG: hypothetical protein K5643_10235 [Saccharofermentans sp.]|nr:hypothetical protein [Saccharofermentans sp.]